MHMGYIILKESEGLTKEQLYLLMKSNEKKQSMTDKPEGTIINFDQYVLIQKDDDSQILYLNCNDAIYVTNSNTFIAEFEDAIDTFPDCRSLILLKGITKTTGNRYISCRANLT